MKEQAAEKKALEKAKQYAKNQREYRAMTIARTELAGAYNAGEFYSIKQGSKRWAYGKSEKNMLYLLVMVEFVKGCREK